MANRENQTSEEDSQSSAGNSDMILMIALLTFIVFLAVAFLFIIFDTRGLWYPGWGPGEIHPGGMYPLLNQLMK
jgi:hypothetical protein